MRLLVHDEAETMRLGELVGRFLRAGDVVLLHGELGAGKTTFTRGLARAVGFRGRVSSPTYALVHAYRGRGLTLRHIDLYRLKRGELGDLDLDELLADPGSVVVVEWPRLRRWPDRRIDVRFAHAKQGRAISVEDRRAS